MMEWMVDYGKKLVAAKGVWATNITYLRVCGVMVENTLVPFKPFLPGLLWSTKRLRGNDKAKVLV